MTGGGGEASRLMTDAPVLPVPLAAWVGCTAVIEDGTDTEVVEGAGSAAFAKLSPRPRPTPLVRLAVPVAAVAVKPRPTPDVRLLPAPAPTARAPGDASSPSTLCFSSASSPAADEKGSVRGGEDTGSAGLLCAVLTLPAPAFRPATALAPSSVVPAARPTPDLRRAVPQPISEEAPVSGRPSPRSIARLISEPRPTPDDRLAPPAAIPVPPLPVPTTMPATPEDPKAARTAAVLEDVVVAIAGAAAVTPEVVTAADVAGDSSPSKAERFLFLSPCGRPPTDA